MFLIVCVYYTRQEEPKRKSEKISWVEFERIIYTTWILVEQRSTNSIDHFSPDTLEQVHRMWLFSCSLLIHPMIHVWKNSNEIFSQWKSNRLFFFLFERRKWSCCFSSRFVFSILFREQSSQWLDELTNQLPETSSIDFSSSTVLALYIRRKFFVVFSPSKKQNNDQEQQQQQQADQSTTTTTLTFFDWIDLLLNGNFREPINLRDWPEKFH